jgi:hypothetical protein
MKCIHCQGAMKRRAAPFHVDRKSYHLVLDAVPAWWGGGGLQCGESYFEEAEAESIQEAIQGLDTQTDKLAAIG